MDNKVIELVETNDGVFEKAEKSENALVAHAKRELDIILNQAKKEGNEEDIHMQEVFNKGIIDIIQTFSDCGHSGFSASMAIKYLDRLLRFQPLMPLTLEDDEWAEVGIQHIGDNQIKVYQNKRASNVFKQADRFDGKPYCIDGPDGQMVTLEEYPHCYIGVFNKKGVNNEETN